MLTELITEHLTPLNISHDDFSELMIRLLDYGVLSREESLIEARLYDRYIQCEALVDAYLSVIKVRLQHDRKFHVVRLFPPGAAVPGLDDDTDDAFNNGFRVKPNQQEVATIIVLRVEYEKSVREGQVDDKGCVLLPMEALAIAFQHLLKRSLPDNLGDRKAIFKRLKQLRLINYNADSDLEGADNWISIQPSITQFVGSDVLTALYPNDNTPLNNSTDTADNNNVL